MKEETAGGEGVHPYLMKKIFPFAESGPPKFLSLDPVLLGMYSALTDQTCGAFVAIARDENLPVHRRFYHQKSNRQNHVDYLDHLTKQYDTQYRLYEAVNRRNLIDAAEILQDELNEMFRKNAKSGEIDARFKKLHSRYKSHLMRPECADDNHFLFDYDKEDFEEATRLKTTLMSHTDILEMRETPNGWHVITKPFNYHEVDTEIDYEMKHDGLTFIRYLE